MPPVSPAQSKPSPWTQPWLPAALLLLAVALAYANSLTTPFVFDDDGAVVDNTTIRQWSTALTPPTIGSATTGRPIVNLSFALNHAISGQAVWSYHALNLLIHAAAALTLLGLLRRIFSAPLLDERLRAAAAPLALAAAALWALHPLLTESVTCVAQRTESLCGLLILGTLYGFARGTECRVVPRGRTEAGKHGPAASTGPTAHKWLIFSAVLCWIGMATKEVMVTTPLLVLLYDRTFVAGSFAAALRLRRGYYAALAPSWLLLAGLVLLGGGTRGVSAGFGLGISPWSYLLTQADALVLYLRLSVVPFPLVLDYGTAVVASLGDVWWQGLVVLALLAGTGWALVRRPVLGFAGAWCFILLAPSSSVVPLITQTVAEHRMYLPLAALVALAVPFAYLRLGARVWLPLAALACVFAGVTAARNHDYRSPAAIWQDTVLRRPDNARAHVNYGIELGKLGQPEEALKHFARAIALDTEFVASGHYHSGATCLELGRLDEALAHLQAAVRIAPEHSDAQFTLANALVQAGRPAEAVAHFEAALRVKPAADAHCNLGLALARLGRDDEAMAHFAAALQLQPDLAAAHFQFAKVLARTGRADAADAHFAEAVRLAPDQAEAQGDYGVFLAQAGRLPEAVAHLQQVVRLRPASAEAHANLGNALLFQGRTAEAIARYEEALRLKPDDPRTRENLQVAREALRTGP
jgi:tetratricopeptide (TPR) repeat protein